MITITQLFGQKVTTNKTEAKKQAKPAVSVPQKDYISHVPRPYLPVPSEGPVFGGLKYDKMIQSVKGKGTIGAAAFTPDGHWRDFKKVGKEFLEDLDVTKASDKEIYAYWDANAMGESQHKWTAQYNRYNMQKMPATYPSINDIEPDDRFRENRVKLWDFSKNHSLDVPITDKNGNLSLDCVVFDTETTGLNIDPAKLKGKKPLDKIVQVGAIQVKNGQIVAESAISQLINPEMPIPEVATNVHGITDFAVRNAPTMGRFLRGFTQDYLHKKNGVLVIYNARFDEPALNASIRQYNSTVSPREQIKERQSHKILDPFILLQRIHPYVGVKKKLGDQYRALFCKEMKGAHDALADVTGTADVLKYCLYWLSEHRKDKTRPLMLREVLAFQNGERKLQNLDFRMDGQGCNADVNFMVSQKHMSLPVVNHPRNYTLGKSDFGALQELIGPQNLKKLIESRTKMKGEKAFFVPMEYKKHDNFIKVLGFAKMEPYKEKPVEELHEAIAKACFRTTDEEAINIFIKNTDPDDIPRGNDLPDINIVRKVIQETKGRKEPTANPDIIKLEDTPGANAPKGRKIEDYDDD